MCPHVTVGVDRMCVKLVGYAATAVASVSRPAFAEPSTTLPPPAPPVVDGRHKAGHDTRGTPARYFNAFGACSGHEESAIRSHWSELRASGPTRVKSRRSCPRQAVSTRICFIPGIAAATAIRSNERKNAAENEHMTILPSNAATLSRRGFIIAAAATGATTTLAHASQNDSDLFRA